MTQELNQNLAKGRIVTGVVSVAAVWVLGLTRVLVKSLYQIKRKE